MCSTQTINSVHKLELQRTWRQLQAFLLFNDRIITFRGQTISRPHVCVCSHETSQPNVNGVEQRSAVNKTSTSAFQHLEQTVVKKITLLKPPQLSAMEHRGCCHCWTYNVNNTAEHYPLWCCPHTATHAFK